MYKYKLIIGTLVIFTILSIAYSVSSRNTQKSLHETISQQSETITSLQHERDEALRVNKNLTTTEKITTKKPDGTVTVDEKKVTDLSQVSKESSDKEIVSSDTKSATKDEKVETTSTNGASKYRVFVTSDIARNIHLGMAARLGNLPIFLQVEGGLDKEVRGGVSVEF